MRNKDCDTFMDEYPYELENRIKNLIWTVSGDYSLRPKPDIQLFHRSENLAVYEGVKQGGLSRYFDQDAIALYLLKKIYCHADQAQLLEVAQLCIEEAVGWRLDREREGVRRLREKAYEDVLEMDFRALASSPLGMFKAALLREYLDGTYCGTRKNENWIREIHTLHNAEDAMEIIRKIDELYNQIVEPDFEKKKKTLAQVLAVTLEELTEFSWKDLLDEDADDPTLESAIEKITEDMLNLEASPTEEDPAQEEKKEPSAEKKLVLLDEKLLEKSHMFVERSFGRTYMTPVEEKSWNYQMCRGMHETCSLYFTDGILHDPVLENAPYVLAKKQREKTREYYRSHYTIVQRNIKVLTDMLRKALVLRDEEDEVLSDAGQIRPVLLWKVGRTQDNRLFSKKIKNDAMDFVVDLLIDASGSQRKRQMQVAMQAYIISETMSNLQIPCRVMSFCTFWDYTVLRRFREYDEDRRANRRLFEFTTSSNNRDGLAVRAVGAGLLQKEETNKVMIVLSDGKPYDVMISRPGHAEHKPYRGREAALDTGKEIRFLRQNGVSVLGVFVGEEAELQAERQIFGKDFAYIRSIETFSNVVGRYLLRHIEE